MKKYIIISILLSLLSLTSCGDAVEDDFGVDNPEQYSYVYCTSGLNGLISCDLAIPQDTTMSIYATYGGILDLKEDLTVTFSADPDLVDQYNEENMSDYHLLPSESYSLPESTVTIGKGTTSSNALKVNIMTELMPGTGPFLLPIKITSVSGDKIPINEELNTVYFSISGTYSSNPFTDYDRTDWEIAGYSSYADTPSEKDFPSYVLDDNIYTFWGTPWSPVRITPPHYVIIDMKQNHTIDGVRIRARVNNKDEMSYNGFPKSLSIFVSNDNENWTDAGTYSLPFAKEATVFLKYHYSTRYLKVQANTCYSGANNEFYQCAIGEIYVF